MAELNVEIVAVERELWSGEATFVFTRTTTGEIGILPHHIPLVAQLVDDAMVRVEREGEDDLRIAVDGGFLSSRRSTPTPPSRTPSRMTSGPRHGAGRACAP
jgi:F-type H+-transporting ATPase subunit epsilon